METPVLQKFENYIHLSQYIKSCDNLAQGAQNVDAISSLFIILVFILWYG